MAKNTRENSFFETISLYLRATLMIVVVVGVGITAFCWDKMPKGIKNITAMIQTYGTPTDKETPPQNFRAKTPQIQDEMSVKWGQPQQSAPFPVVPVNYTEPSISPILKPTAIATAGMSRPVLVDQEVCQALGEELKQMGATSFRLESWGNGGQYFRFSCAVSINPQTPHISRYFDAIAENGADAMRDVIKQISDWKNTQ